MLTVISITYIARAHVWAVRYHSPIHGEFTHFSSTLANLLRTYHQFNHQ